jgi:carbon storage regulator
MLVLMRRPGESIRIGDDVVITVTRVEGDRVSIGIQAPREVPILRDDARKTTPKEPPCTR